jgi:uncharacterized protein YdhG (YjbR/CyaY superfamily)
MKMDIPAKDINEYLAVLPEETRNTLEKLRTLIKNIAPQAVEKISYQVPTFYYLGPLVGFAAFKNHCSFFVMSHKVMDLFKEELKPYDKSTATIRFPADKPLPESLVENIIQARITENETIKNK